MGQFPAVREKLERLASAIASGSPHRAETLWGGADVVIDTSPHPPVHDAFYPEPRYVITRFAPELSWLFEQLRDAFTSLLDGASKIEFFGRLALAAQEYLRRTSPD